MTPGLNPDDPQSQWGLYRPLSGIAGPPSSPGGTSFLPQPQDSSWIYGGMQDPTGFSPQIQPTFGGSPASPQGRMSPPPGIARELPPSAPSAPSGPPVPSRTAPPSRVQNPPSQVALMGGEPTAPQEPPTIQSQSAAVLKRMAARDATPLPQPGTNWAQRLGLAILSATKLAPYAQQIIHPKYSEQMASRQAAQAQDLAEFSALEKAAGIQGQAAQRQAMAQEAGARVKLLEQQAETLAEEGKRAPKGNFITFGKDGIFDAQTGTVLREPTDPAKADYLEIDPSKGQALGIMPNAEGKFIIPKEGIGPLISASAKPVKTAAIESVADQVAARNIALKHPGVILDDSQPLIPQLPPAAQGEAIKLAKSLQQQAPDALTEALKQLTIQQKQAELEAMNAPLDQTQISTTMNGGRYVDGTGYTGKSLQQLHRQASIAGVPVVGKDEGSALQEIDKARMNLRDIEAQITSHLPRDAMGRVLGKALANKISAYVQADSVLAAAGTYRTAAIQLMRAAAGPRGMRINKDEIKQSSSQDIPQITDTVETALQRIQNMKRQLDNGESAILVRDRSQLPGAGQNPNPNGYVQGHVYAGKTYLGGNPNDPRSWR